MKFTFHAETNPGRVRAVNEDSIGAMRPPDRELQESRGDLLVVADGMGGHQSGEIASKQTIETVIQRYYTLSGRARSALVQAIRDANTVVYRRAEKENRRGMGTTVVAAARVGNHLHIAHVGDSRLYLIRDGTIRRLTEDHSLVAEQVAAGLLTPEEAERHPHRNVISRAVGTSPEVDVEVSSASPLELKEGDIIILCSDGLTEHVKPQRIMQLVEHRAPAPAARALIEAANAGGGSDNISVIVARVGDLPESRTPTAPVTAVVPAADAPTAPLATASRNETPEHPSGPTPRDETPERPSGPSPSPRESLGGALFGVLASVFVVVLVGGLGFLALYLIDETEAPIPTATPENNLLVTPESPGTAPIRTTTVEPVNAPDRTATVTVTVSAPPTSTVPVTVTPTDTTSMLVLPATRERSPAVNIEPRLDGDRARSSRADYP